MKICNKCKIQKELSEFGKLKCSRDGLRYSCKICEREIQKIQRKAFKNNPKNKELLLLKKEKSRIYAKKYREKDNKVKNYKKEYYQKKQR